MKQAPLLSRVQGVQFSSDIAGEFVLGKNSALGVHRAARQTLPANTAKSSRRAPAPKTRSRSGYNQDDLLVERLRSSESAMCKLQMMGNATQHSKAIP
jgi:hypothetical protein